MPFKNCWDNAPVAVNGHKRPCCDLTILFLDRPPAYRKRQILFPRTRKNENFQSIKFTHSTAHSSLSLSLSLSLFPLDSLFSLSFTTHTPTLLHIHSLSYTFSLSLTHTPYLLSTYLLSLSLSLSHTHTYTQVGTLSSIYKAWCYSIFFVRV